MERIKIPRELEFVDHSSIVKEIKKLNPNYAESSRSSWPESTPDLDDPIKRSIVEVELSSLRDGWGQCLYYYRMGASAIHFVLSPVLYKEYGKKEDSFIRENPLSNVKVYSLPPTYLVIQEKAQLKRKQTKLKQKGKRNNQNLEKFTLIKNENESTITQTQRKRIRQPLIRVSTSQKYVEENTFKVSKVEDSQKICRLCKIPMILKTYTNNFGDEAQYFECSCDHMEIADAYMQIPSPEKVRYPPSQVSLETVFDGIDNSELNNLLKSEGWKNCAECATKPVVFITSKHFPLCSKHWAELADRNIDWHA